MKPFPVIPNTELFLVGGVVRDILLNKPVKDRDFVVVTKLSFKELEKEIEKIGTIFVSKPEFLTIRCRINKEPIDITFPRAEHGYSDGRRPDEVKKVNSLSEDASRRDFTIGSLFMDESGNILDFFGGKKDLENKIIRTVRDPYERFSEDYLRIARAIRFSLKYGFKIEDKTFEAMKKEAHNLSKISMDRIKDELNLALKYDAYKTIDYINQLGIPNLLKDKGLWFELTNKKFNK